MQVTHVSDHITHAVIGGKKSINFGISDDPAFFQILSSALYKDPMLAMVRETICNAWDAHIEAGKQETPLSITLGDEYLTIKDFGHGIPDSLIGPIYGVYGASTKKNDGRQTGGFGLGCKSPFAYTDHFEVTSCHMGMRTIYNMSKSSAQLDGKPSIVPIASFPTTETGITVKIPLNKTKANSRLDELIRQVVFNGDIQADYNQQRLPVLGLDQAPHGLVLIPKNNGDYATRHLRHSDRATVFVRYGNVIYPIEINEGIKSLYVRVNGLLSTHYNCTLVLLAPPDSISITPSREALTMSDISITTVNSLLGKFLSVFLKNQQLLFRHKELVNEYIDAAAEKEIPPASKLLLNGNWTIPGIPKEGDGSLLTTTDQFAKLDVLLRYSGQKKRVKNKVWFNYIQRYMHKVNKDKVFDLGLMQSWLRTMQKNIKHLLEPKEGEYYERPKEYAIATSWWQKNVMAPIVLNIMKELPEFNRNLMFYAGLPRAVVSDHNRKEYSSIKKTKIRSHTLNAIHLIKPSVILVHNADAFPKRIQNIIRSDYSTGTFAHGTYFMYEVGRKQEELDKVREAFKKVPGIEFLDFTERFPYEQQLFEARKEQISQARADAAAGRIPKLRVAKKVKPGMVRLDNLIDLGRYDSRQFYLNSDPIRIVKPEAVMLITTAADKQHETAGLTSQVVNAITKLYGDVVGVSNKRDAIERQIKENGAMGISDYVRAKIMHDVENLPSLVKYHASDRSKIHNYIEQAADWRTRTDTINLIDMLIDNPEFASLVPDIDLLSDDDLYRWTLWENIDSFTSYNERAKNNVLKSKIEAVPLKPEIITFLDKVIANPFLGIIDMEVAPGLVNKSRNDPALQAKLTQLLTLLLT